MVDTLKFYQPEKKILISCSIELFRH